MSAVGCRFNEVRNNKPHLAKYRWQNIGWYFYEAMATGWLWGAKPLNRKIKSFRVQSHHPTTELVLDQSWAVACHSALDLLGAAFCTKSVRCYDFVLVAYSVTGQNVMTPLV